MNRNYLPRFTNFVVAAATCGLALALAGCGTARVQQGTSYYGALPRPNEIVVHPFAASPEEVKVNMGISDHLRRNTSYSARTAKELEVGRKLAWATAEELTKRIRAMGLPVRLTREPAPMATGIIVIDGALVSVDEGDEAERQVIGLGTGRTQLNMAVRVYEYMPEGRRLIDAFEVDATGGWKPGAAETAAVGIAMDTNPAVLVLSSIGTGMLSEKMSAGIDATAKHGADRTADVLARFFTQHGWIR
jgi:hypothetical protein